MKRLLTCFLILIILISIFTISIAASPEHSTNTIENVTVTIEDMENANPNIKSAGVTISTMLSEVIYWIINNIKELLINVVNTVSGITENVDITMENIIFNRIKAFNISYDTEYLEEDNNIAMMKNLVVSWFSTTRNIAFAFMACFLIYIVIKLITSSDITIEQYKQALGNWVVSFALIFIIHYVIIFLISFSQYIIELIAPNVENGFELSIVEECEKNIKSGKTLAVIIQCILYVFMTVYVFKFIFKYAKRQITVGILIVLAPIVAAMYCIDKLRASEKASLKSWFEMLVTNIFTQLIQALVFVIVLYSAIELIKAVPIFALIFFFSLEKCEKTLKDLFNIGELE